MSDHAEIARLLDILIPNGGDLVTVSEAFFDESYDDKAPRMLCVAAYVFRKSRSVEFGKRWSRYLRAKGLPYFHANECAHACGLFEGRADADEIERKLIGLTKEYSDYAVAVALDQGVYEEVCQGHTMFPTAYSYALITCVYEIAAWRERQNRKELTAFFFEQGHAHAGDAHHFISFLLGSEGLPGRIGYRSHAFVPKETPQVQASDLLAWLWRLQAGRDSVGSTRPVRKDLIALKRPQDHLTYLNREWIEGFRDSILRHSADAEAHVRGIASLEGVPQEVVDFVAKWTPDFRDMRAVRTRARDAIRKA